ncbi:hypothetical protein G9A89_010922 [Geosiphon pyriformis]|nr:hypothetical protein G9A89_010922 [Geosiphon pyriformis]
MLFTDDDDDDDDDDYYYYDDKALCVGHRGFPAKNPENTMRSLEQAILFGADGLESDVQLTSDGEIIMMHDNILDRTTNGTGYIIEREWKGYIEYLKSDGEPVPRFQDVLDLLKRKENKNIFLIVDIKETNPLTILDVLSKIIDSNAPYDFSPQLYLGVWTKDFLKHAQELFPKIPLSYIGSDVSIARHEFFDNSVKNYNFEFKFLKQDKTGFIDEIRKRGRSLFVWTVDKPKEMREAIKLGVDAILTNVIDRCVRIKKGRRLHIEHRWRFSNH